MDNDIMYRFLMPREMSREEAIKAANRLALPITEKGKTIYLPAAKMEEHHIKRICLIVGPNKRHYYGRVDHGNIVA